MKKTEFVSVLLIPILLSAPGCRGRGEKRVEGSTATTQTVAPAAAQPSPTGTDAMTQTVDVEDGRSEEDGAMTMVHDGTTRTTTRAAASETAPPKPKSKPPHKK